MIRPRDGIFQPSRPSLSQFFQYRNSPPSAVERGFSPSSALSRRQSNFRRVSSSGALTDLNSLLPLLPPDPCRFLSKNFRCTACAKLLCRQLCRFDSRRTMHSLEQWSFRIFRFLRYLYHLQQSYSFLLRLPSLVSFSAAKRKRDNVE